MATPTPLTVTSPEGQGPWQIFLLVLYLVLILVGVFYATRLFARLAQRGMIGTGKKKVGSRRIFLIDRLAFDRDKSIMLVEEGDKRYLLGVTAERITVLREMDAPPPDAQAEEKPGGPYAVGFGDMLKIWKDRTKG